jgi:hypothetical protein
VPTNAGYIRPGPAIWRFVPAERFVLMPVRTEWHLLKANCRIFVIPAQAGIQEYRHHLAVWIPTCAGMTVVLGLSKCHSGKNRFLLGRGIHDEYGEE